MKVIRLNEDLEWHSRGRKYRKLAENLGKTPRKIRVTTLWFNSIFREKTRKRRANMLFLLLKLLSFRKSLLTAFLRRWQLFIWRIAIFRGLILQPRKKLWRFNGNLKKVRAKQKTILDSPPPALDLEITSKKKWTKGSDNEKCSPPYWINSANFPHFTSRTIKRNRCLQNISKTAKLWIRSFALPAAGVIAILWNCCNR
jgi:hypothetical protein